MSVFALHIELDCIERYMHGRNETEYIKRGLDLPGMIFVQTFWEFVRVDDFVVWFMFCLRYSWGRVEAGVFDMGVVVLIEPKGSKTFPRHYIIRHADIGAY